MSRSEAMNETRSGSIPRGYAASHRSPWRAATSRGRRCRLEQGGDEPDRALVLPAGRVGESVLDHPDGGRCPGIARGAWSADRWEPWESYFVTGSTARSTSSYWLTTIRYMVGSLEPGMGSCDGDVQAMLSAAGLLPGPRPDVPISAGAAVEAVRDSYRGALIGTAIGDALGRPAEGRDPHALRERYGRLAEFQRWSGWKDGPTGTVTDDTQMTMCVAECLVANDGWIDPADLARRFVDWLPVGRGKGHACTEAVSALLRGVPWYKAGVRSAGNGAAMRAAPVGLAHVDSLEALRKDAALSAVVTHADPTAVASAVAHAWLVAHLASTRPGSLDPLVLVAGLREAMDDLHDPGNPEREWERRPGKTERPVRLADRLAEVPALLDSSPEEASDWLYCGAFVLESLPMALWHFLNARDDPERAVVDAVMGGHDADTVASMTGAYVGAYLGENAFPARWVGEELEFADRLRQLADELLELCKARAPTT